MRTVLLTLVLVATSFGCTHDKTAASTDKTAAPPSDQAAIELRADCCTQCANAAKRDPAGMGLEGKDCAAYAGDVGGQPGVGAKCVAHFGQKPTTVGDCWKDQPQLK